MSINSRAHHSTNFAPALRVDVRFVPQGNRIIRLYEPTSQRYVRLYQLECHLAQIMNGHRGLDELTAIAQQFNTEITHDMVERLVVNLNAVGLLERPWIGGIRGEVQSLLRWQTEKDDVDRPAILESAEERARRDFSLADEAEFGADVSELVRNTGAFDIEPVPAEVVLEGEVAPEGDVTEGEVVPAEAAPEVAPEEIAAQEQEQLHKERSRRWYQRKSLRFLAVLGILTTICAFIPYPLRITSECTVFPSERIKVRTEIQGVISEILVDEGRIVKKGDVIVRLDDRALKAERSKMLAEIEKFEAELKNLKKGRRVEEIQQQMAVLAARRTEAGFAAKQAQRRKQMVLEGVGSQQLAEDAMREHETRLRAVTEAEATLRLYKAGARPDEISSHEAVVKRARAELAYINQKLEMTVIRAPIDGEILTPRFRERLNEAIEVGGQVCEVANTTRMRAEIYMPQRFFDEIEVGMPATIKVESYPTHPFEGKVDFIAPAADDGEGRRVRVVVQLDNAEKLLKSNMTGYGEVEAGEHSLLHLATRRITRWVRVRFLL